MDLTPEQLVDEASRSGGLEPVEPVERAGQGQADLALPFPPQDYDLGPVGTSTTRAASRPPGRLAVHAGRSATVGRGRRGGADGRPQAHGHEPAPLAAIVPLERVRTRTIRQRLLDDRRVGRRPRDRRRRARIGRPATCSFAVRRAPDRLDGEALAGDGETDLEAARRLALALDQTTLPIQGPPGSGKTYTGRG